MTVGSRGGVPDAEDLLDSVVECLREELLPGLSGRDRYQTLVCIAAVEIVRREICQAEEIAAAEERLRQTTGKADDRALVDEIRAGGMDAERFAVLVAALSERNVIDVTVARG